MPKKIIRRKPTPFQCIHERRAVTINAAGRTYWLISASLRKRPSFTAAERWREVPKANMQRPTVFPVPSSNVSALTNRDRPFSLYFTFSQTVVWTLIFPSLKKGAGRVVRINLSPSIFTSLICVVPVHTSFAEMSTWCCTTLPSKL